MITQSGHIVAQNAQPIHLSWSVISAGECPLALILSFAKTIIFLGHALTQSEQPLHKSELNVTFAILILPYVKIFFLQGKF